MDRRDALKNVAALMGGIVSAPTVAGMMAGCQTAADAVPYAFQTLTGTDRDVVATLAEIIIPETDTPGALGAKVDEFIDIMLTDYYDAEAKQEFLDGLAKVDAGFLDLSAEDQQAMAMGMQAELSQAVQSGADRPWFGTMKELTIAGYYTSEIGATQELTENPMGTWDGDIPYSEVGKSYA